jgi:hypothetical protein
MNRAIPPVPWRTVHSPFKSSSRDLVLGLAIILRLGGDRACLIPGKFAGGYGAVEGRVWPVDGARDKAVFDWVDVNVADVPGEVVRVTYRVLPITALPELAFCFRSRHEGDFDGDDRARELPFYAAPTV